MTRFQVTVDADLEPIMDRYFEIQRGELLKMEDAVSRSDGDAIRMLGHKLKGTGTSYGFTRMTELGLAIEQSGVAQDYDKTTELIAQVRSYMDNVDIVYKEVE